jgi:hypothetical protein
MNDPALPCLACCQLAEEFKELVAARRKDEEVVFYSKPHGHFLLNTVTPIYQVAAKEMANRKDHAQRRNYDDCNEFFWSPLCLE